MATLDKPHTNGVDPPLVEELHQLEREEHALERRTDGVEWRQWIAIAMSTFALGVAIFAATITLTEDDDNATQQPASAPAAQPATGMPTGMSAGGAAATRAITVELGEMYVKPDLSSISAGKVTFHARNVGKVDHELMVEPAPIRFDAPGKPTEEAATGMIEEMGPGAHGRMTMTLGPGKYELFCNVPGHYAAGQHTRFTVTEQ